MDFISFSYSSQLFGEADADEDVAPDTEDPELVASGSGDDVPTPATKESTRQWAERIDYDSERLLSKLYREDVRYLLSMEVSTKSQFAVDLCVSVSFSPCSESDEHNLSIEISLL